MIDNHKKAELAKLKGKSLQFILNEAFKIFGNPLLVYDTSYKLFSITENVKTDDWIWNEIATTGTFSYETVKFFGKQKFILAFAESEIVFLMQSDELKYDRCTAKLFDSDNVQLGNVTIVSCFQPFAEGDMELLEYLSEILSPILQKSQYRNKIDLVFQETIFDQLFKENVQLPKEIEKQICTLNTSLKPNKFLAVVDISQCEDTLTHLAYFRGLLQQMQPEYHYFVHLNNIIIVLSSQSLVLNIPKDIPKLYEFFCQNNIYAGISSVFSSLFESKKYFKQAINALNYGLKCPRKENIFKYDEFRLEHRMHINIGSEALEEMKNTVIMAMQQHDSQYDTMLTSTLYHYMAFGMDTKLAAQALNITPKELKSRLDFIQDTFDINWKNGDMLCNMYIHLALLNI